MTSSKFSSATLLSLLAVLCVTRLAVAGDVTLRGFHQAQRAIIQLSDVADLSQLNEEQRHQLDALPLFPAPRVGASRRINAQDVRETMSLYGLSLPAIRLTGECRVDGFDQAEPMKQPLIRPASVAVDQQEPVEETRSQSDQLVDDLIAHLQSKDRIRTQWKVAPQLTTQQTAALAAMERPEVSGGQAPWTGRQVFGVRDRNALSSKPLVIKVDVERIAQAVVTKKTLAAGDIVGTDDVELGEVNPQLLSATVLLNVSDALGKEIKRATPAGQVVQTSMLQRPLVVKRGELITVFSLAAGVQIKATAKALGEGALGDVILLEATETKKHFQGRVTAPQEAMVFVDTPQVAAEVRQPVREERTATKSR